MEESETAASCYDRVYAHRAPSCSSRPRPISLGSHRLRCIRQDASWNVPEPELTLVLSADFKLVGYTIGNDMSSRNIEGDNPLYLPQAKVYDQCCGLRTVDHAGRGHAGQSRILKSPLRLNAAVKPFMNNRHQPIKWREPSKVLSNGWGATIVFQTALSC